MVVECRSIHETHTLARKLASKIPIGSVVALIGDLGTGKTTFTQGFSKALKVEDNVGSPTFKLVSEYDGSPHRLYHIDAYRLEKPMDFINIGGETYLYPDDGVTLIEWANIIEDALPENTIYLRFSRVEGNPETRLISVDGITGEF